MKKKVLVVTSGYKRWQDDENYNEDFVVVLTEKLSEYFNITVLSPIDKGAKKKEVLNGIKIYRHRQSLIKSYGLAYGSGIMPNISKNKFLIFKIPFFILFQFIKLCRIANSEKIDVIHCHWMIPQGFVAVLYKKLFNKKIKILINAHGADILGDDFSIGNGFRNLISKFILNNCDEFVTGSNEIRKIIENFNYKKNIYVYSMGVDTEKFNPGKRDKNIRIRLNIKGDIILFVGSIIERKGVRYLVQAIPEVVKKYPDVKFLFAGEGNLKEEMIKLAEKLHVDNNVNFLGYIDNIDKPKYFATADIFTLPSLSEGFGIVNIEAMSSGAITIVSDLDVFQDILENNVTGLVAKQKDSKDLSEKLIYALDNKEKLKKMRINAREHVVNNFDWKIVTNNFKNLIDKM